MLEVQQGVCPRLFPAFRQNRGVLDRTRAPVSAAFLVPKPPLDDNSQVTEPSVPTPVGRYLLYDEVARGGMASVHFGRLTGPAGFSRTVAIKKLHAEYASDPEFCAMFLDEARLAARVRHPNVVSVLDVVSLGDNQVFLVMDYVQGESLARLIKQTRDLQERIPPDLAVAVISGVLYGLHAAHETKDENQRPLEIVHRDVSPQNVLLGSDGVSRVVDFGVAKAAVRIHTTRDSQIKGKLPYMAPEQLRGVRVDRRTDVYSTGVVLWEMLTGERLFTGPNQAAIFGAVLEQTVAPPSQIAPGVPPELDELVLGALSRNPDRRPPTARELAVALERAVRPATQREVGDWVHGIAGEVLEQRAGRVAEIESSSRSMPPMAAPPAPEPVPSQVSSISVSSPLPLGGRRKRRAGLVAVALLGAGLIALGLLWQRQKHSETPEVSPVVAASVSVAPVPEPEVITKPEASVVEDAGVAPAPKRSAPRVRPGGKKLPANCFTVDKDGVLHPKPECM
jgi:serine/threonine-protein kinase